MIKMARPYRTCNFHTVRRRVPRDYRLEIDNPECWRLYGHYNGLTADELQDQISFLKDHLEVYEDEINFITDLGVRKRLGNTIKPL